MTPAAVLTPTQIMAVLAGALGAFHLALAGVALARRIFKSQKPFGKIAISLLIVAMGAGTLAPFLVNHLRAPRWVALAPPGAGFAVELPDGALVPSRPEESAAPVESPFGPLEPRTFRFTAFARPGHYIVSYVDYPEDAVADLGPEGLLDEVRDATVASSPSGRLVATAARPLGPHPGREYRFETDDLVMRFRSALVGRRLILMSVAQNRRGLIVHRFEGDGKAFLESLRLEGKQ